MDEFRVLVEQTSFDSAELGGPSVVVHKFAHEGPFQATVLRNGVSVGTVAVDIGVRPPAGPAERREPPHVDLRQLARAAPPVTIEVAQGYALFHAPGGERGYAVTVQQGGGETFDSRELGPGDVFSALVLRPGTYALKNTVNGTEGTITVDYPVVGPTPYQPPEALSVEAGDAGFAPAAIALRPAQGLAFHVSTRARITIHLVAPDDGRRQ
jgi:hypothetical protein